MEIVWVLLLLSLFIVVIWVAVFLMASKSGQFTDSDRHAESILFEDVKIDPETKN